ncbi:MAG: serine/threonine protein kinase [Cyanobacteria bacterium]|nr:serine/threonine protein kinase [Cyanobacteriota bacterium]
MTRSEDTPSPLVESPSEFSEQLQPSIEIDGRYQILKEIGQGGMGRVYQAFDPVLKRTVAIKVIRNAKPSDEQILRMHAEAKAAGKLSHPNVVGLYDFGRTGTGDPYIVMEYAEGETLTSCLARKAPLSVETTLHILEQILTALKHAHSKGIIHRDLKPSNLILSQGEHGEDVRILDFGVAKIVEEESGFQTLTGCFVGSPSYISPEQARGEEVDWRTDIYSLGCIAFVCLTGMRPFEGETSLSTIEMQIHSKPPDLNEVDSGRTFPDWLNQLVLSMLEKDREVRCKTIDEVLENIQNSMVRLKEEQPQRSPSPDTDCQRELPGAMRNCYAGPEKWEMAVPIAVLSLVIIGILSIFFLLNYDQPENSEHPKGESDLEWEVRETDAYERAARPSRFPSPEELKRYLSSTDQKKIDLSAAPSMLTEEHIKALAAGKVTHLYLISSSLSEGALKSLHLLKSVKTLDLWDVTEFGDKSIDELLQLPVLTDLNLRHTSVTAEGLRQLSMSKVLWRLTIAGEENALDGLKYLKNISTLHKLIIMGTRDGIDAKNLQDLKGSHIEYLKMFMPRGVTLSMGEDFWKKLQGLPNLKTLSIANFALSRKEVAILTDLPINKLFIEYVDFEEGSLEEFAKPSFCKNFVEMEECHGYTSSELYAVKKRVVHLTEMTNGTSSAKDAAPFLSQPGFKWDEPAKF